MAICRIVILIKEILDVEHIEGGVVYYWRPLTTEN